MSLGILGQYGSESDSSDRGSDTSEHNGNKDRTDISAPKNLFGLEGSPESDGSGSEPESSPSPSPPSTKHPISSLPLPDIDKIVASNATYSNSELLSKSGGSSAGSDGTTVELGTDHSSAFFNPYKKAEEDRLAILKHHVSEFDKKPAVEEEKVARNERASSNRFRSRGRGSQRAEVPPPMTYARQRHTHSSSDLERGRHSLSTSQTGSFPASASGARTGPSHTYHNPRSQERCEVSGEELFDDKDSSILAKKPRKHRSGVGDSLMPPKKFMKQHREIQARERPWTLND